MNPPRDPRWSQHHVFDAGNPAAERGTRAVMWLTAGMMVAEIVAGWWFNSMASLVIAVDCTSGVDCDSGEVAEETIPADLTVTMEAVKQGLVKLPAFEYVGEIEVVDISLPDDLASVKAVDTEVAEADSVAALLPERPLESHKGTFGTALIAAGSVNYTGAGILAGEAAYRVGAGLVTLAVPAPLHGVLAGQFPEATWVLLPHEAGRISENAADVLARNFENTNALLIGPGFGTERPQRSSSKTCSFLAGIALSLRVFTNMTRPEDKVSAALIIGGPFVLAGILFILYALLSRPKGSEDLTDL